MICWWTNLPSSSVHKLWLVYSCCIFQNNQILFFGFLALKYFSSFLFHAKIFNYTVFGAIATNSASTHDLVCVSHQAKLLLVSYYAWNHILQSFMTRNPNQTYQSCIAHRSHILCFYKIIESHNDLLHLQENWGNIHLFIYFHKHIISPPKISQHVICKILSHEMTNKRTFTPPRKHVENLFTFSDLQSHHCERSEPNFSQNFSLHPLGTMQAIEIFDIKFIKCINLNHVEAKTIIFESILHKNTFSIWPK